MFQQTTLLPSLKREVGLLHFKHEQSHCFEMAMSKSCFTTAEVSSSCEETQQNPKAEGALHETIID